MLFSSGRIRMEKTIYYCLYQLSHRKAIVLMIPTNNCRFILARKSTISHCIVMASIRRIQLRMAGSKFDALLFSCTFFFK